MAIQMVDGYATTDQIVPNLGPSPWAQALGNITDTFVANSLQKQRDKHNMMMQENRWAREDAKSAEQRAYNEEREAMEWERGTEDRELTRDYKRAQIENMGKGKQAKLSIAGKAKLDKLQNELDYALEKYGMGSKEYKAVNGELNAFLANTGEGGSTPRPQAEIQAEIDALTEGKESPGTDYDKLAGMGGDTEEEVPVGVLSGEDNLSATERMKVEMGKQPKGQARRIAKLEKEIAERERRLSQVKTAAARKQLRYEIAQRQVDIKELTEE